MALIHPASTVRSALGSVQAVFTRFTKCGDRCRPRERYKLAAISLLSLALTGCAGVKIATVSTEDYIAQRRGDILTSHKLSASARDTLTSLAMFPSSAPRTLHTALPG